MLLPHAQRAEMPRCRQTTLGEAVWKTGQAEVVSPTSPGRHPPSSQLTTQSEAHFCLLHALCQGRAGPQVGQFSQRGLWYLLPGKLWGRPQGEWQIRTLTHIVGAFCGLRKRTIRKKERENERENCQMCGKLKVIRAMGFGGFLSGKDLEVHPAPCWVNLDLAPGHRFPDCIIKFPTSSP